MKLATTISENDYHQGRVLLYVKKNGFPVDNFAWERLQRFASKSSTDTEKIEKKNCTANNLPSIGLSRSGTSKNS